MMADPRINLTDLRIRALRPGEKRLDSQVPGLIVRAHKTRKSFALYRRFPGKGPTRRNIGEYGALTIEQARQIARDWTDQIRRGIDPALELKQRVAEQRKQREAEQRSSEALFRNVAESYLTRKVKNQRQHRSVERMVRNVLIPAWGDRPISEITRPDVRKLVEDIDGRGAPIYAFAVFGCARTLFGWATNRDLLEHSPCDRIKIQELLSRTKEPRQRVLSDDELVAFWKATGRLRYPWRDLFRLLLLTGTRRSEVAGARWGEFELDKGLWSIPPERFKSNSTHLVPLSDDAKALVAALPRFKHGDHLFSFTFGRTPSLILHDAKVRIDALMLRYLKALARLRGDDPNKVTLPSWVTHDLRRTVRTRLAKLRVDHIVAEMAVGHAKRGLQRVYDQYSYEPELRHAFEIWATELRRVISHGINPVDPMQPVSNVTRLPVKKLK
jgi:integrase